MKKLIENLFGVKIFSKDKYEELLNAIANCGNIKREYDDGSYTNYGQYHKVSASDLSAIHCVENVVWDDIKSKIDCLTNV